MKTATVKLNFETRKQAETFSTLWTRFTKRGNIIGSGTENVEVTFHDVTPIEMDWIMERVNELN